MFLSQYEYSVRCAVPMFGHQSAACLNHAGYCGTGTARYQPILEVGSRVLAAAHSDHDDGEEEEEAGHGEAHSVHRLVADNDVTVHQVMGYARYA